MITQNELDAMRQAAINYRAYSAKQKAADIKAIEYEQSQRQAEERKLIERAAAHRAITGEWPLEMEALPVLEYQRIRRLALIYASKNGIVFPKKVSCCGIGDQREKIERQGMSNLPPGCTDDDIEHHAEGSCPDCGKTLRDGYCAVCETVICDKCGAMVDPCGCKMKDGIEMCEKCAEQAEDQQAESEET